MTIKEKLLKLITSDDYSRDDDDRIITSLYKSVSDADKDVIDIIFVTLCGYSLKSIINDDCN